MRRVVPTLQAVDLRLNVGMFSCDETSLVASTGARADEVGISCDETSRSPSPSLLLRNVENESALLPCGVIKDEAGTLMVRIGALPTANP
jgi:hypothetical protein